LRRQALDRLRAGLVLTAELLKDGKVVVGSLTAWQNDPTLASVHDPAARAKLPDAEREQWRRLWADVEALLATDPLEQGQTHAARRHWDRAADGYARRLKRGPRTTATSVSNTPLCHCCPTIVRATPGPAPT
jgi:hypothetical protein